MLLGGGGAVAIALLFPVLAAGSGGAASVRLQLQPALALRDAPLDLRISGLHARQKVVVSADERSGGGHLWRSSLAVRAGANGSVTLQRALLEGLMRPVGRDPAGDQYPAVHSRIEVSVLDGKHVLATASVVRLLRPPGVRVEHVRPRTTSIYGDYFIPGHASDAAPLIYLGGSSGGLETDNVASLLAAHGNPVLSLAYFSEPGLPGQLRNIPLEYFRRAIDWLRRQPQVHGRRVVVAGESYGGEAALLIGATYPGLVSGVIALVPNDSVTGAPVDPNSAAWSRDGRPLAPGPISVQKIKGPIFAVGSVGDALWQSGFYVRDLKLRLQGHDPRPTILDFETAGHAVGSIIPNISTETHHQTRYGLLDLGGTRVADERARDEAWPQMLAWLEQFR
jgi:dienelactone hydrolase